MLDDLAIVTARHQGALVVLSVLAVLDLAVAVRLLAHKGGHASPRLSGGATPGPIVSIGAQMAALTMLVVYMYSWGSAFLVVSLPRPWLSGAWRPETLALLGSALLTQIGLGAGILQAWGARGSTGAVGPASVRLTAALAVATILGQAALVVAMPPPLA